MGCRNQRIAHGSTLVEEGKKNDRLVVLDADLSGSTMGEMFKQAFLDRHYKMGVAEVDMASIVVGLSLTGWIPFTNSFTVFSAGRAYDQIRQAIAVGNLNVKTARSSAGLSDFGDGAIHQAIGDMACMYAVSSVTVTCPAGTNETVGTVKVMIRSKGPCYLRLDRNDYDNITEGGKLFIVGKPSVPKQGMDVTMFTTGYMAPLVLAAARELEGRIFVRVVSVSTIKSLDQIMIIELTRTYRGVVTAEEYTVTGGLGSVAAQALVKTGRPVEFMGISDIFGCSGHSYQEVLEHHSLTKKHIVDVVRTIWEL